VRVVPATGLRVRALRQELKLIDKRCPAATSEISSFAIKPGGVLRTKRQNAVAVISTSG
jgi:hypothetical protein